MISVPRDALFAESAEPCSTNLSVPAASSSTRYCTPSRASERLHTVQVTGSLRRPARDVGPRGKRDSGERASGPPHRPRRRRQRNHRAAHGRAARPSIDVRIHRGGAGHQRSRPGLHPLHRHRDQLVPDRPRIRARHRRHRRRSPSAHRRPVDPALPVRLQRFAAHHLRGRGRVRPMPCRRHRNLSGDAPNHPGTGGERRAGRRGPASGPGHPRRIRDR